MTTETRPTIAEAPKVPQVSIGMPVYNGEKYIREALDSLLRQTFTDFELIISDNASTDGTEAICRGYAEGDARIRYVRQIGNLGPLNNFRFVLNEAVGEYFMWAAYDDIRSADFIKVLLNGLKDNTDFVSAFGVFKEIDDEGKCFGESIFLNYSGETPNRRIYAYWIDFRALKDVWIYGLHRRRALNEIRLKPWAWVNKNSPNNSAHPVLIFMLAKGRYYFYSDQVIFYRRVLKAGSLWTRDSKPRKTVWRKSGYFLLKLNLIVRSASEATRGSGSIVTGLLSLFLAVSWVFSALAKQYLRGRDRVML